MAAKHNVGIQFNVDTLDLVKAEKLLKDINKEIRKIEKGPMSATDIKQLGILKAQQQQVLNISKALKSQEEATIKNIVKATEAQKESNKEKEKAVNTQKESNKQQEKAIIAQEKEDKRRSTLGGRASRALGQSFLEAPLYSASFALLAGLGASIQQFVQLDKTLTRIAIVTDRSTESMKAFAQYANDAGKALGVTGQRFAEASLIFLQQGGLAADYANSLAESSIKLANITGTRAEDTSEYITAIANSFNLLETDGARAGARIVDMLASLDAASGSSADEIAEAFKKSASSFAAAGFSAEEASSMIAVISETTRQAPELIGTGMKTLIGNLSEMKVGSEEFTGITNKLQDITKKFGMSFSLVDKNTKNIKTLPQIFDELAKMYAASGDEAAKRAIIEAVAGKEQRDRFIALVTNQERYNELLKIATNSSGSADAAQSKYLESITGKLEKLKNEWEELVLSVISSDAFKGLIDALTNLLANFNELNKEGGAFVNILTTIGGLLSSYALLRGLGSARSALKADIATGKTGAAQTAIAAEAAGGLPSRSSRLKGVAGVGSKILGAGKAIGGGNLVLGGLVAGANIYQAAKVGMNEELTTKEKTMGVISAILPTVGMIAGGAIGSFFGPVGTMAGAAIGNLAGTAISGAVGVKALSEGAIAARDELNKLSSAAAETLATSAGQRKVSDLLTIVSESGIDKTTERYKEAADQLGQIMPGVIAGQDEYGNTLLRSTDEIRSYVEAQKELNKLEQVIKAPEILSGYIELINAQIAKLEDETGPELQRAANLQIELLTSLYTQGVQSFFKQLVSVNENFTESQSVDIQRGFTKIMSEGGKGLDSTLTNFYNTFKSLTEGKNKLVGDALVAALAKLFDNSNVIEAIGAYGKDLQIAQEWIANQYSNPENFNISKEEFLLAFKKRFPRLKEEDFKELGGDAYYKFISDTIDDTERLITEAQKNDKFTEVLTEIFTQTTGSAEELTSGSIQDLVKNIISGSEDLSQALEFLGTELRDKIINLQTELTNAIMTSGEFIPPEVFEALSAQAKDVGMVLQGTAQYNETQLAGPPAGGVYPTQKTLVGYTSEGLSVDTVKLLEMIFSKAQRGGNETENALSASLKNLDDLFKKIMDKYALLFSNLSIERQKALAEQNDYIQSSPEWEKVQKRLIDLTNEELELNKKKRIELEDYLKTIPAGIDYDEKRHQALLEINNQYLTEIRLLEQVQQERDAYISAPFLDKLRKLSKYLEDVNRGTEKYKMQLQDLEEYSVGWEEIQKKIIANDAQTILGLEKIRDENIKLSEQEGISATKREEYAKIAKDTNLEILQLQNEQLKNEVKLASSPLLRTYKESVEIREDLIDKEKEYSDQLQETIENSTEWISIQKNIIENSKAQIVELEKQIKTNQQLLKTEGLTFEQRKQYQDQIDQNFSLIQDELEQQAKVEEDIFNAPFLDSISKANEALEDQRDLLSTLNKSDKEYLSVSDGLIAKQIGLYNAKLDYIRALEAEESLSASQLATLADLRDEVFLLGDAIKKASIELALEKFYKAMYGEVDLERVKERFQINLDFYDDLIDAHEQIIEKTRLELEIQKEIETTTNQTYKTNLKYLQSKIQDGKLNKQQILAIKSQITLLKALSEAGGAGEAQQFKLTRGATGAYRFAPTVQAQSTAERQAIALEAATQFETQAIDKYREISDKIFAVETQAGLMTQQGRTAEAETLTALAGSLRGQLGGQSAELEKGKVITALVEQGQLALASKVTTGQVSVEEAMSGMTAERRAALQESIAQSKISVLAPDVAATEKLVFTNEKLITALSQLTAAIQQANNLVSPLGAEVSIPLREMPQYEMPEPEAIVETPGTVTPETPPKKEGWTPPDETRYEPGTPATGDTVFTRRVIENGRKIDYYKRVPKVAEPAPAPKVTTPKVTTPKVTTPKKPVSSTPMTDYFSEYLTPVGSGKPTTPSKFPRTPTILYDKPTVLDIIEQNKNKSFRELFNLPPLPEARKNENPVNWLNQPIKFDTGGYTGDFTGGKMAMLHEKELVLNKLDTDKILRAVELVRTMPQVGARQLMPMPRGGEGSGGQVVNIHANFPNVSSAEEIKRALSSMSSQALQYAYRTKSY